MMAQNHAQIANRWQSHFSNLFLGKPTSWQELQDAQERFHQSLPLIDKNVFVDHPFTDDFIAKTLKTNK
jgi:hypothetical protein